MPEAGDVDKLLAEQKAVEDRRKALIEELLKKREAQNKEIDDQLAKLGYQGDSAKARRSHHRKAAAQPAAAGGPKGKDKAG